MKKIRLKHRREAKRDMIHRLISMIEIKQDKKAQILSNQ